MKFRINPLCLQVLLLANMACFGQASLPKVIPPSPNAWIFQKFTDVPVSYYNGLPGVDVPLYTVKTGGLEYPLSLSYHTGGIRAEDKASWVGLNWTLNGVGMISRTINGSADDVFNGFFHNPYDPNTLRSYIANLSWSGQLGFERQCQCDNIDFQPDIYYLNVAGMSVKFFMTKQKVPIQINKTDNKIVPIFSGTPISEAYGTLRGFEVITPDGTIYYFGDGKDEKQDITPLGTLTCTSGTKKYRSAWFLNKIISTAKDTIHFDYETDNSRNYSIPLTTTTFSAEEMNWKEGGPGQFFCSDQPRFSTTLSDVEIFSWRLKTIRFAYGKVELYASARQDTDAGNKKLDSIKVFDDKNVFVTGVKLSYDYYLDVNPLGYPPSSPNIYDTFKRLRLVSLHTFTGNSQLPPYQFEYNGNTLPFKRTAMIDHWGYYNASSNGSYMPYVMPPIPLAYSLPTHAIMQNSKAYRMSTDSMTRGVLTKIIYPTGGYSQFDFEPNEVYMRCFTHSIKQDKTPFIESDGGGMPVTPFTFFLNEINAIPDTAATAQVVTVTNLNPTINFSLTSQSGQRFFRISQVSCPDYSTSNLRIKLVVSGANPGGYTFYWKTPYEFDNYFRLMANGNNEIRLMLVDEFEMPVYSINDPISISFDIKADILDYTIEKNRKVGGLRIKQIINHDAVTGVTMRKYFEYNDEFHPDRSSGSLTAQPVYFSSSREGTTPDMNEEGHWCGYLHFSEKSRMGDTRTGGSVVGYNYVTEYSDENGQQGKVTYKFTSPKEVSDIQMFSDKYPFPPAGSFDWIRGALVRKDVYQRSGSSYELVQRDTTYYAGITKHHLTGAQGAVLGNNFYTNHKEVEHGDPPLGMCLLNLEEYNIPYGGLQRLETKQFTFDPVTHQPVTTTSRFFYDDSLHVNPVRIETYDAKGNLVEISHKYPYNFAGVAVYDSMVRRNIIAPVIQEIKKNVTLDKELTRTHTNYQLLQGGSQALPLSIQTSLNGNPPETEVQFNSYDPNQNILEMNARTSGTISYIWDYLRKFPIAEVTNGQQSDIAYCSFEAEGNGNWTIPVMTPNLTDALTGSKSVNLTNAGTAGISKTGLNTQKEYIVSYWRKNTVPFTVSGSQGQPLKGKTVNGWTYFRHIVSGVSTTKITGDGLVDELRLYPKDAKMTTYTYRPLAGPTSKCDVNDAIVYYEYDSFNRLKLIRDEDGRIQKQYDYQYQVPLSQ